VWLYRQSAVGCYGGGLAAVGTMTFVCVPELDRGRRGFVAGDFVLLWGWLMSRAGDSHVCCFTHGKVEVGKSSVWVET
jgi:hypothetical protein